MQDVPDPNEDISEEYLTMPSSIAASRARDSYLNKQNNNSHEQTSAASSHAQTVEEYEDMNVDTEVERLSSDDTVISVRL